MSFCPINARKEPCTVGGLAADSGKIDASLSPYATLWIVFYKEDVSEDSQQGAVGQKAPWCQGKVRFDPSILVKRQRCVAV